MDGDNELVARTLPAENVLALSRASALASDFTQLDQFWVAAGADIARDADPARRTSRAESLTMLGDEMARQLGELGKLGPQLRAAAEAMSDEAAKTLADKWPPRVVETTLPDLTVINRLPAPTQKVVEQLGQAVLRGISDPQFPEFIGQSAEFLASHIGIPAAVIEQGVEFVSSGGDISLPSVVESIAGAVTEAGIPLPAGFGEAASIFTFAVSAAHGAGGDALSLLPALGGLVGAIFGVPLIGHAIGALIEWIAHRVMAEDETHH